LIQGRELKTEKGVNQKQWIETYHNMWVNVTNPLLKLGIEENADAYFLLLISTAMFGEFQ